MSKTRNKIFAILIIIALIFGWFVSIHGLKGHSLKKDLKYGLDINGGVYVLLEADTKETGTELTKTMNQTKSVLENRVNAAMETLNISGKRKVAEYAEDVSKILEYRKQGSNQGDE